MPDDPFRFISDWFNSFSIWFGDVFLDHWLLWLVIVAPTIFFWRMLFFKLEADAIYRSYLRRLNQSGQPVTYPTEQVLIIASQHIREIEKVADFSEVLAQVIKNNTLTA